MTNANRAFRPGQVCQTIVSLALALCISAVAQAETPDATPSIDPPAKSVTVPELKGTVRKITETNGNLITSFRDKDFAALGIGERAVFQLAAGGKTYEVTCAKSYGDVPEGAWVAITKPGGIIWIARNHNNAAATAGLAAGDEVTVRPVREKP